MFSNTDSAVQNFWQHPTTRFFMESTERDCNLQFLSGTHFDTKNTMFYARDGVLHVGTNAGNLQRVLTTADLMAFATMLDEVTPASAVSIGVALDVTQSLDTPRGTQKSINLSFAERFRDYCESTFSTADHEQMLADIEQAEIDFKERIEKEKAEEKTQSEESARLQEEWRIECEKREVEFRKQQAEQLQQMQIQREKEIAEHRAFLAELHQKEQEAHLQRTNEMYAQIQTMVNERVAEIIGTLKTEGEDVNVKS
jgi:hypothetical protein